MDDKVIIFCIASLYTAQWTHNLLKTLLFKQLCLPIAVHLKDKERRLPSYLPVLWTINNICVSQQFAETERIMECHSDPLPLHNIVWVVMQYNILSVWKWFFLKISLLFWALIVSLTPEQRKETLSDSDANVLWSVHHFRARGRYLLMTSDVFYSRVRVRARGRGFVLPFSLSSELYLSVRLQMLPSAHLGRDWAVRCERDPQQQGLNENKALPCVVTHLCIYSFFASYQQSCGRALQNQCCCFAAWLAAEA